MAASTYFAQVQQLYIAYFGRPADTTGLNFWANQIDAANGNIAAVQAGFSASAESTALFGNKSNIDKVTAIYVNAFGRQPDATGLTFWVNQLDTGKLTQAQAAWTIQQSAGSVDAAVVQAKLVAAQAFTAQIDTAAEIQGYQGTAAADSARSFLAGVTSTATGVTAVSNAASAVASAVAVGGTPGSTLTFTTGVDTLVGTSNNDTFVADTATAVLGVADSVNGGAGVDTLKVFLNANTSVTMPTLTNVENVTLNGGGVLAGGYSAVAGTTGLTIETPNAVGTTYTVAGQAVTLKGFTGTAGTTTIASTADTAANVTLNGWGTAAAAQTVALTGAAVATANLTATGVNSVIALNGTSALKTLNIAGDKTLTVTTDATTTGALTSINASTSTGGVSVNLSAANTVAAFAFTGSAGNDTLTIGATELATLTAGSQLNGGAGTDTLAIANTSLTTAEAAKLNAVTGFEVLGLTAANSTVDASQLTGFKTFALSATGDTISNLGSGTTVNLGTSIAAATLSAALGNTSTEVVVGTAGAAGVTVGALTATGLTTLGLTSNGTSANTITALTNSDNSTITVKGATDLTIGSVAATSVGSKIDASAFTGKLTVTGSGVADIIIGGSGADTIKLSAGADTITLGAGADVVTFNNTVQSTNTAMTTVTDFVSGTDKIDVSAFSTGTGVFTTTAVNVSTATTLAQALDLAAAGDGSTAGAVKYFQFQSNTYVVADNTAAATFTAASDSVIKLTGLVNLTAADVIA